MSERGKGHACPALTARPDDTRTTPVHPPPPLPGVPAPYTYAQGQQCKRMRQALARAATRSLASGTQTRDGGPKLPDRRWRGGTGPRASKRYIS